MRRLVTHGTLLGRWVLTQPPANLFDDVDSADSPVEGDRPIRLLVHGAVVFANVHVGVIV